MRLVCLSDTHNRTDGLVVPDGDLLLHAGDLTGHGKADEIAQAARWLASLPHRHKVVVAGNHDFLLQDRPAEGRALLGRVPGLVYLEDELVELDGLRIYGTPWQPWFYDWAYNLPRDGEELAAVWAKVPDGVDVLLTHSPAYGIVDRTSRGDLAGCERLRAAMDRIKPRLHVCGHIHEAYGEAVVAGVHHVNASTCDLSYRAVQSPIVVEW
jgi:Icc-related predicted phosphoesterase